MTREALPPKKTTVTMLSFAPMVFDQRIQNEACSLRDAGYDVTIIFVDDQEYNAGIPDPDRAWREYLNHTAGIKSIRIWLRSKSWKFLPSLLRRVIVLLELFARFGYAVAIRRSDIYHAHDLTPVIFCFAAKIIHRAKIVYDAHEFEIDQARFGKRWNFLVKMYEQLAVNLSSLSVTVNEDIAKAMTEEYDRPVEVVENRPKYHPNSFPRSVDCSQKTTIMYVGYVDTGRGILETVSALRYLPVSFEFEILGAGRLAEFRDIVYEHAMKENVDVNRIKFIGPVLPFEVVPVLSNADVSVMLYQRRSQTNSMLSPNKFYQSVMARVPIIASNYGRLPDLVERNHGGLGVTVDERDPKAIACGIRTLVERNEFYKKNLDHAAKAYCWEAQEDKLLSMYKELVFNKVATSQAF
ncbi:MAG: glycosyltransferase [Planctomycetales bacterium]|nr:glycosyltransferase [Planctomycetales bacterium]